MSLIFHIDVNCAFLSWEATERLKNGDTLDLRTIPSAVGGSQDNRRGIILAKSYPAKAYNIKTGETVLQAKQKCPNLIIVPPNRSIYETYSQAMFDFLYTYTYRIQRYSIDEVFLDLSDDKRALTNPYAFGEELRTRIYKELGFTVCVGIGNNKILAKMAGELKKPNYTNTLFKNELYKIHNLPVNELFMVGSSTTKKLSKYGITTIGELANSDVNFINTILKKHGVTVWNYANGIDSSKVDYNTRLNKSYSNSSTLKSDIITLDDAKIAFMQIVEKTSTRLRKDSKYSKVVSIYVKYNNFTTYTHQHTLSTPTNSTNTIYETAIALFEESWNNEPVRAIGVRLTEIEDSLTNTQLTLFDIKDINRQNVEAKIDTIRKKYGNNCIIKANQLLNNNVLDDKNTKITF